ncbi:MAG: hypothetical protein Ct9H300mP8_06350 [Gammaproteobacteria bacterium]|nr:MAG: hypothetical protein Ct9H300mP8_06350 [Gammaproteobacteria bacterium]
MDRVSFCRKAFPRAKAGLENPFGLGYFDGSDGELTHFIWGEAEEENGPYGIEWIAYRTTDQLFELLALIRSLGDQVIQCTCKNPRNFSSRI